MFGLGAMLAVLVDATLVRMVLLPAFMHMLGRLNWRAPARLAHLYRRIGISESGELPLRELPSPPTPAPGAAVA